MILNTADNIKVGYEQADKVYVGNNLVYTKSLLGEFPGAALAFSLRQLTNQNLNVVRVKRSSDKAESDFKASDLTDGTVETYVGSGNDGYVAKWYDQSGNGNHAIARDPSIPAGSTLEDNTYLDFKIVSSGSYLGHVEVSTALGIKLTNPANSTPPLSIFGVNSGGKYIVTSFPYGYYLTAAGKGGSKFELVNPRYLTSTVTSDANVKVNVYASNGLTADSKIYSSQSSASALTLMASGSASYGSNFDSMDTIFGDSINGYTGKAFELIVYQSNQAFNITNIAKNQRQHYSI